MKTKSDHGNKYKLNEENMHPRLLIQINEYMISKNVRDYSVKSITSMFCYTKVYGIEIIVIN